MDCMRGAPDADVDELAAVTLRAVVTHVVTWPNGLGEIEVERRKAAVMRSLGAMVGALAVTIAFTGSASAAPPAPFGHSCTAQNGVRFCPTADSAHRVPTFDGVPLDADVTLPANGTRALPDHRDDARLGRQQDELRVHLTRRPLQQQLLRPPGVRRPQLHGPRVGQLVRRGAERRSLGALRQGLHPPGRHSLRGSRHSVSARPPGRRGDHEAARDRRHRGLLRWRAERRARHAEQQDSAARRQALRRGAALTASPCRSPRRTRAGRGRI